MHRSSRPHFTLNMASPHDPLLRPQFSPLFSVDVQISPDHSAERFHVLKRGQSFYLRLQNHLDWLGIVASDNATQMHDLAHSQGESLYHALREMIFHREWGRVISLPDPDPQNKDAFWRVLWKGKRSFLMWPDTSEAVDFRSDEAWKRGAWIQPGEHFAKRLAREWKNPTSDVRGALAFLQAGDEARRLWGVEWVRGGWEEMNSVLRAATIVEYQWGERTIVQSRPIYPQGKPQIGFGSNAPQSGRLLRLIERLEAKNSAVLRDKSKLRRLVPLPFSFEFGVARWPELRAEVEPPSEHEKLEARLELRDWLQDNDPDLEAEWNL